MNGGRTVTFRAGVFNRMNAPGHDSVMALLTHTNGYGYVDVTKYSGELAALERSARTSTAYSVSQSSADVK